MTTYNGPTPYTEELELFRRVAPASATRHILEGLETAYRRGWGDAKAEDAPLLEALEGLMDYYRATHGGHVHREDEPHTVYERALAAIAAATGKE